MSSQETERLSNQVTWLYNEYRTALYNVAYYGTRLKKPSGSTLLSKPF